MLKAKLVIVVLIVLLLILIFYSVSKLLRDRAHYKEYTVIRIGTITDQTGPLKSFGEQCRYGYSKAAEAINKDGGIFLKKYNRKLPVEILYADHSANEKKAITETEYLCLKGAVVISGSTAVSPFGITVAEKNKVPMVESNAHSKPFLRGYKYVFCAFFQDNDFAKWPFELMHYLPAPKPVKIGYMEELNEMGHDYFESFIAEASKRKFKNIVVCKYKRFSKDFSGAINTFKKSGVDFVYAPMLGPDGRLFWQQMKNLNYVPKAVLMLSAPANRREWLFMGKDADYVMTSNVYHWATGYPGSGEFAEMFRRDHNGENPTELAGNSYAMIQVIKAAIEKAGSLNKEQIRDALAESDVMTIMGRVRFRPNGMNLLKPFIVQYIKGKETIIWPADMAERSPVYPFPAWNKKNR